MNQYFIIVHIWEAWKNAERLVTRRSPRSRKIPAAGWGLHGFNQLLVTVNNVWVCSSYFSGPRYGRYATRLKRGIIMGIMIIVGFAGEKRTKIRYDTCLRCFWKLCCKNKKNVGLVWRRRAIWDKERKRKMLICLLLFSRRKRSPAVSIFLLFSRLLFVIIVCVIYIYIYTIYIVRPQKNWENQMGVVRVSCICVRKTCIARNTTGENLSLLLPVSLSERSFLERVCVYVCVCVCICGD